MTQPAITEEMVNRFLSWRLPDDFSPDCGISFKRINNEQSSFGPATHEPTGTNLLDAVQARAMLEHVLAAATDAPSDQAAPLQPRVQPWLMECFGPLIAGDREERNHRFLEEALELVQACGCNASEARQLVEYVFSRPVGEKGQEAGGTMITLAALCLANDLDMHAEGERELARITQPEMVIKIRAKQAAKPKYSPLPIAPPAAAAPGPVTQAWTHGIPMMQQSVLLSAIRGPDGLAKYGGGAKMLLRWLRRCVLLSAMDGKVLADPIEANGGSFTGPSLDGPDEEDHWSDRMQEHVNDYLRQVDALPHHFQMHFLHAAEIIGYKHPDAQIRLFWNRLYLRLVNDFHLWPETEEQMDSRLGDSRRGWLERADPATIA